PLGRNAGETRGGETKVDEDQLPGVMRIRAKRNPQKLAPKLRRRCHCRRRCDPAIYAPREKRANAGQLSQGTPGCHQVRSFFGPRKAFRAARANARRKCPLACSFSLLSKVAMAALSSAGSYPSVRRLGAAG